MVEDADEALETVSQRISLAADGTSIPLHEHRVFLTKLLEVYNDVCTDFRRYGGAAPSLSNCIKERDGSWAFTATHYALMAKRDAEWRWSSVVTFLR